MRVVVAGGSGFLGTALVQRLIADGHSVVVLSRGQASASGASFRTVSWNADGASGPWAAEIDGVDAVVNLSGAGMADRRWSAARKKLLHDSRILSTRSLVAAVSAARSKPAVFIQGSAVGFYGSYESSPEFDESSAAGSDYLGDLCVAWEREARALDRLTRVVYLRTAPALSAKGGALKKLIPPFKLFAGGPVSSGKQPSSWIHLQDWVSLVVWAIGMKQVEGPLNAASPHLVSNLEFSRALGRALHRPCWMPVPAFVLKAVFGQMATEMLLRGQHVVPRRALDLGFAFKFLHIDQAMADAVRHK